MSGLTSRQQWTHDHITRCPTCGAWEVITEREAAFRQLGIHEVAAICKHFNPSQEESTAA